MNITTHNMSDTVQELKDIRLVIKIDNKNPVELMDLTKSLVALASQFNTYVAKNGDSKENREAKLFVKEIKTGSIILDLIEVATVGALPFLENVNTIVGFAEYVKSAVTWFLNGDGESPEFSSKDCSDFSQIVNPVANDRASQLNVSTTINGNVTNYLMLSSRDANALQNILKNEIKSLSAPEEVKDIYDKVVMSWDTAKSNIKKDVGNKGVIESIAKHPTKVIFETDDLKEKVLKGDENPLKTAYVVDVKVETVKGKIAVYKVVNLHESFPIEE